MLWVTGGRTDGLVQVTFLPLPRYHILCASSRTDRQDVSLAGYIFHYRYHLRVRSTYTLFTIRTILFYERRRS